MSSRSFYDLINQLQKHLEQNLPFVVYHKPNDMQVNAQLQQNDDLYSVKDYSESGFVMAPFEGLPVLIPAQDSVFLTADFLVAKSFENYLEFVDSENSTLQTQHEQLVQKGMDAIKSGAFEKVVLSRSQAFEVAHFDWKPVYEQMLNLYPNAFAYCFFHPKVGMWLGAFSEQLVQYKMGQLKTMAVAGTQLFAAENELIWGEKEKQEQQIVTDFILDGLKQYASNVTHSEPYTMQAGRLVHIRTDIEATLTETNQLQKIIAFLHPTPAVCGFPKDAARKFILEHEGYDRAYYAGFLGELNVNQTTDLFVNLRCMQVVDRQKAILYIGGGITVDSHPEKEWQETVNKAQTMKRVLTD